MLLPLECLGLTPAPLSAEGGGERLEGGLGSSPAVGEIVTVTVKAAVLTCRMYVSFELHVSYTHKSSKYGA